MEKEEIKRSLIKVGVKNLKEYGYPKVDESNILTDKIYSAFFKEMLEQNKGVSNKIDVAINEVINSIKPI